MKKLYALLLTVVMLLAACGTENRQTQAPVIDEKIYETFTFDESPIVSQERREISGQEFFAVSGGENPAEWHYIDEFDGEGRLLRATCYFDREETRIREVEEYSYADHGYYVKTTQPGDDKMEFVEFSYFSRDGLYKDVYHFSHLHDGDIYALNTRIKIIKSRDGKTSDMTNYDMNNVETTRTVTEKNDEGAIAKATFYSGGKIKEVAEYDWGKSEARVTVYKEEQPHYVKVTTDGGNNYTYFDLEGNPIDKPL